MLQGRGTHGIWYIVQEREEAARDFPQNQANKKGQRETILKDRAPPIRYISNST
jgi:hypothetical protein